MLAQKDTLSTAALVQRVRKLMPFIAEHAERAELDRKPVDAVIAALEDTGVFKAFVPRKFGGFEIDIDTFIDIGLAVGEACTSTGWITTFYMEHNWIFSQFSQEAQEAIFGTQPYLLAPASISPNGKAEPCEGGFRLNGRWSWGTGVMHADWVILNGLVVDGERIEPRLFIVRRDQIEVEDVWFCDGMEGTGSNDMIASDLIVPEAFSEPLIPLSQGRGAGAQWHDSPSFRHPMMPLLAIAAATPALAAARSALALFTQRVQSRVVFGTGSKQGARQAVQIRLGTVASQLHSAEILLRTTGRELEHWGEQSEVCPPLERARMRLAVAQVVRTCRDAVTQMMEASGAGAHMKPHPMQRIARDVNTLSCHTVFDLDIAAENYGLLLLGMDPASPV